MKKNTETLLDDYGFEIIVTYNYEESPSQIEEGHGLHDVGNMIYTELTHVELIIKGSAIQLLPVLNDKQKDFILNQLNYNNE